MSYCLQFGLDQSDLGLNTSFTSCVTLIMTHFNSLALSFLNC